MKKQNKRKILIAASVVAVLLLGFGSSGGVDTSASHTSHISSTSHVSSVDTRLKWEIELQKTFPNADTNIIKKHIPNYSGTISIVEKTGASVVKISNIVNDSICEYYYIVFDKNGEIMKITTTHESYDTRITYYPTTSLSYTSTTPEILTDDLLEDWADEKSVNTKKWINKYVEAELMVSSIEKISLNKVPYTLVTCEYGSVLIVLVAATYSIEANTNLNLYALDSIFVQGQILDFNVNNCSITIGYHNMIKK